MTTTPPHLLGQFGLSRIGGRVGRMVWVGQAIIRDRSRFTHAFLVLDRGQVVEAMPGGAILTPLSHYTSRPPGEVAFSRLRLTEEQKSAVVAAGRSFGPDPETGRPGVPYSFLDYLSLGLAHLHVRPWWLKRYIASYEHMICSELVDAGMVLGKVHLFADHRIPGDVSPGDLSLCLDGEIPIR